MLKIPLKALHTIPALILIGVSLCIAIMSPALQSQTPTRSTVQAAVPDRPSDHEIIQRIDAAVYQRFNAVIGYTVQEQYSLFHNGSSTPTATETVLTTYLRSTGKQYKTIAQTGSSLVRSAVLDRILTGEKEVNLPANRESALLTSRNYNLRPEPGTVEKNGRQCIAVDIRPRRKSPHLFNGKAFVDASDFTVVRLEGSPSQSPSFLAGDTTVSRDYIMIDGFSMATHAVARYHSFFFGDTLITIDYTNYKIDLATATLP